MRSHEPFDGTLRAVSEELRLSMFECCVVLNLGLVTRAVGEIPNSKMHAGVVSILLKYLMAVPSARNEMYFSFLFKTE